jgi:hypothetical protein
VNIEIEKLSSSDWKALAADAHKVVFEEIRPAYMDRIDYALLAVNRNSNVPLCYVTVRELDNESVYWQFGGAFPSAKDSIVAFRAYQAGLRWTKDRYERVTTLVENQNVRYLKMAMAMGFRIIGVRTFKGQVLCELLLEFGGI